LGHPNEDEHMTDASDGSAGTDPARRLLRLSEQALADMVEALDLLTERFLTGNAPRFTDVKKVLAGLSACRDTLIEEIHRNEERVLSSAGPGPETAIDLNAARRDIGRRLDRLRAQG
jgi:hypothetical protein